MGDAPVLRARGRAGDACGCRGMPEEVRRFARLRTLCEGALELPEDQRPGWIGRMCEGDEELIAEVEEILRRVDEGGTLAEFFNGPRR